MSGSCGEYRGSKEYLVVYRKLIRAAQDDETMTYGDIAPILGLRPSGHHMGVEIGKRLDEINRDEHRQGRPMLSAVVVGSESGIPGDGFFKLARKFGNLVGETTEARRDFWVKEKAAVYSTWRKRLRSAGC